jgi:hypothetical protein
MLWSAQIISGFISFGTLHIKTSHFEPWQWLMIITGILTLITSVSFWYVFRPLALAFYSAKCRFFFPDSPTNAWFLTPQERAIAVMRIQVRLFCFSKYFIVLTPEPSGKSNGCREQKLQKGTVRLDFLLVAFLSQHACYPG